MAKRFALVVAFLFACAFGARPNAARAAAAAPQHGGAAADTVSAAGGTAHGEGAKEEEPGLVPKLDKETMTSAIWVIIIFALLLAVLYPTAWKQVLAGLKAREQRIRDDIANAERSRREAEASLKDYQAQLANAQAQIREMLAKATVDGEKLATNIRMQAQKEAEEAKERATRDIEVSKNAAIGEIYTQAADLATSVASKILRRNLNADDQRQLVRESLDQLQTIK